MKNIWFSELPSTEPFEKMANIITAPLTHSIWQKFCEFSFHRCALADPRTESRNLDSECSYCPGQPRFLRIFSAIPRPLYRIACVRGLFSTLPYVPSLNLVYRRMNWPSTTPSLGCGQRSHRFRSSSKIDFLRRALEVLVHYHHTHNHRFACVCVSLLNGSCQVVGIFLRTVFTQHRSTLKYYFDFCCLDKL